jgi:membrane fusion protein (multidrug efflux system)
VQVDALPGRGFKARIEALDSQVDANGRSLLVRARLDNREGVLRPGMFARARTELGVREDALVVPEEALVPQAGKQFLFLAVAGPEGKVSRKIEAKLGMRVLGKAEVLEGLKEGDLVVTAGQARLMRADSLPLRPVDLANAGKSGGPGGAGKGGPGGAPSGAPGGASGAASGATPGGAAGQRPPA